MQTYTFTEVQLRALLQATLDRFTDQDGVFDFSPDATAKPVVIDEVMANILRTDDLPFDGRPVIYDIEDNISQPELGLTEAM